MTNELFLFIILVLILLYFLPERKHDMRIRMQNKKKLSNSVTLTNPGEISNENETENETDSNDMNTEDDNQIIDENNQSYNAELVKQKKLKNKKNSGQKTNEKVSIELINDYLSEAKCEEGFDTMGPGMNIGNNMDFKQQMILPSNNLDKSLSKSMVPDFEPSYLNINPDLNQFGYATNMDNIDNMDNNYYAGRGFINPMDASKYANTIQYNLAHPYQTRYCDKQN